MNIVLCYPVEKRHIDRIQQAVPDATLINAGQEGVNDALPDADVFCGHAKVPVDWDRVVVGGRLKWIQSSAAGLDHCLVPSVIDSPITVTSASGLFADQVAEQTMALLFGLIRSMPVFSRAQQAKEFIRRPTGDLHGKTVGIIGFGGNGRRIAEVLAPFRVRLLATDLFPTNKPEYVDELWPETEQDQLLAQSDIVILCVPLNTETKSMINADQLAKMKPGSLLVNVARGQVVVEADLVQALRNQHLSGAGLDVTEIEPLPTSSPLWELPNVIITPHVGAQAANRVTNTTEFFCNNLKRYLSGDRLINVVNKSTGVPLPAEA